MQTKNLWKRILISKQSFLYFVGVIFDKAIHAFAYNIVMAMVVKDLFNATFEGSSTLFLRGVLLALGTFGIALFLQPLFIGLAKYAQKERLRKLRQEAYEHMLSIKVPYFEQQQSGNILQRLSSDIAIIEDLYEHHIPRIVFMVFLGFGSLVMMFFYSLPLTLLALFFEVLSITLQGILAKKVRKKSDALQDQKSKVQEALLTNLAGWKTTKLYGLEETMQASFEEENKKFENLEKDHARRLIQLSTIDQAIYTAKTISLIGLGVYLILQGSSDIGTLFAIMNLMNNLGLLSKLGEPLGQMQSAFSGAARLEELLEEETEERKEADSKFQEDQVLVQAKNLSFAYQEKPVLKNFSMQVNKGDKVALKGGSGSGKSTFAKLLLGFYPVKASSLWIKGKDILEVAPHQLRANISYVSQEPVVFSGTIRDNLLLGNKDAKEEDLIKACKKAHAHDFITKLEDGYLTKISEDGQNLSRGQKQRICIARALLKQADLLLLDEPCSALDEEASKKIEQVIKELDQRGQAVLVITHHLHDPSCVQEVKVI